MLLKAKSDVRAVPFIAMVCASLLLLTAQRSIAQSVQDISPEKFVPSLGSDGGGGTLELRAEATIYGQNVYLKQVCRWPDRDDAFFAPIGNLLLMRIDKEASYTSVSMSTLKAKLRDAGINLAVIRLSGAMACTVARSDLSYDEQSAMQQWLGANPDARDTNTQRTARRDESQSIKVPQAATAAADQSISVQNAQADAADTTGDDKTLRQLLTQDLAVRLSVDADALQIDFAPRDEQLLQLRQSQMSFHIEPQRVFGLGRVEWTVSLTQAAEPAKRSIAATARLWQKQLVAVKPIAYRQVIQDADVTERVVLVDHIPTAAMLKRQQAVDQQASQDLQPGTVLTARMVNPVPLVRQGQLVTITITSGGVSITAVARAMEQGVYGQTVRVRNEETRETYEVIVTGPQRAQMSSRPGEVASVN